MEEPELGEAQEGVQHPSDVAGVGNANPGPSALLREPLVTQRPLL